MNTALTFWQRFRGVKMKKSPLYIPRCQAIHTFGMKESLDLEWVDRNQKVIRKDLKVVPGRIKMCRKAFGVIEYKSSGQALVETALVLPWIMVLLWSLFQIGILLLHQYQLLAATNLAAEALAQTNNNQGAEEIFYKAVPSGFNGNFIITSQSQSGAILSNNQRKHGDLARFSAEWNHQPPLRFLTDLWKLESESLALIICNNPLGNLPCR